MDNASINFCHNHNIYEFLSGVIFPYCDIISYGGDTMKEWCIRLGHIWQMIPENHRITLRVKRNDGIGYYTDGYFDKTVDSCPYYRQFAPVLSVYAISTEIIEVTINENLPKKEG